LDITAKKQVMDKTNFLILQILEFNKTIINQYQPISTNINQYQPISTSINQYQQVSTNINKYP